MLKRIAVLGKTNTSASELSKSTKGADIDWVAIKKASDLPAATAAVVADAAGAKDLLQAATALGARQEQLLELLSESIDCRESFLPGSSLRVRDHATRLAKALGLSPDDQLTLERSALVRDVGKLRIPNDVLLKADVLTYDEWELLHKHTEIGAELVAGLDALKDTADIVRCHHECYDGDGYPQRLERDAIPYLARAMKIIDVYCAMTSPRHYRKGQNTHEAAIEHLRSESGKHFDPEIAQVFIEANVGRAS